MRAWRLTVRHGSEVVKESHASLDAAIESMRRHADSIRAEGGLPPVEAFRTYEPAARVRARLEVTAPGRLRRPTAGVDVKGDGTLVPYRGEIFKRELEPGDGESEIDAVRAELGG